MLPMIRGIMENRGENLSRADTDNAVFIGHVPVTVGRVQKLGIEADVQLIRPVCVSHPVGIFPVVPDGRRADQK